MQLEILTYVYTHVIYNTIEIENNFNTLQAFLFSHIPGSSPTDVTAVLASISVILLNNWEKKKKKLSEADVGSKGDGREKMRAEVGRSWVTDSLEDLIQDMDFWSK